MKHKNLLEIKISLEFKAALFCQNTPGSTEIMNCLFLPAKFNLKWEEVESLNLRREKIVWSRDQVSFQGQFEQKLVCMEEATTATLWELSSLLWHCALIRQAHLDPRLASSGFSYKIKLWICPLFSVPFSCLIYMGQACHRLLDSASTKNTLLLQPFLSFCFREVHKACPGLNKTFI